MTVENGTALSKSAAKKLAAKQAKEAKKAETQARYVVFMCLSCPSDSANISTYRVFSENLSSLVLWCLPY
jgi:hypothetical protein